MIYRAFRALWQVALFAFFRRVDVQGRERVPRRGPVLLVANHANAFVDPLLILTALDRPVSLTAKSTLRKNPLLAPLIRALHVIEFHRAQDQVDGAEPARNVDAMAACVTRLEEGGAVCIFPEGVSHSDPAMRPLKTGAARIALDFLDRGGSEGLTLVPAGLYYEAKERFRSVAGTVFGPPLDLAQWRRAHPDADVRTLTAEIDSRLRALTANFESERDVRLFTRAEALWRLAGNAPAPLDRDPPQDLEGRLSVIHRLQDGRAWLRREQPERVARLEARVDGWFRTVRALGISPEEAFLPMDAGRAAFFLLREIEVLLVGLPMAAWGGLNHLLPYQTLRVLVRRMSKDRDHVASNAIFLGLPILPFFYALQILAAALLLPGLWAVLYALTLPLTGAVALLYRDRAGGIWRRTRTFLLFLRHPEHQRRLRDEANGIVTELRSLDAELSALQSSSIS